MATYLTEVDPGDADQLERDWGIKVAVEMLHEGLVSPMGFLVLCAEAAGADDARRPAPSHSRERRRACAAKRERRDRHVALSTV
jgi:hypothetical protein